LAEFACPPQPTQQLLIDLLAAGQLHVGVPAALGHLLGPGNPGTLDGLRASDGDQQMLFAWMRTGEGRTANQVNGGLLDFLAKRANGLDASQQLLVQPKPGRARQRQGVLCGSHFCSLYPPPRTPFIRPIVMPAHA
jgi:hypothetical protein